MSDEGRGPRGTPETPRDEEEAEAEGEKEGGREAEEPSSTMGSSVGRISAGSSEALGWVRRGERSDEERKQRTRR